MITPDTKRFQFKDKVNKYSLPIIILVASHADTITNKQEGDKRFEKFEQVLTSTMPSYASNIYSSGIIFNCNPDDSTDSTLAYRKDCSIRLHSVMKDFIQSLPFMYKRIPIRWFIMATIFRNPPKNNQNESASSKMNNIRNIRVNNIMAVEEVKSIAKDLRLYENDADLAAMLAYLNDLGEIFLCSKNDQNGHIVTNVKWLLKILCNIIHPQQNREDNLNTKTIIAEANKTGRISRAYVDQALSQLDIDEKTKDYIINLMQSYNILCTIGTTSDNNKCQYFIPCLLPPDEEKLDSETKYISKQLYLGYDIDIVPNISDEAFYCLLSLCIKKWNNTNVKLYYRCAYFFMTKSDHYLIVKKETSHISIQYCYQKTKNAELKKAIDKKRKTLILQIRPQKFIKDQLSSLMAERMPKCKGARIRYYVRCLGCNKLTYLSDNEEIFDDNIIHHNQDENKAATACIILDPDTRKPNKRQSLLNPFTTCT